MNETRSSHPSSAQVEALVEFMERNPGLAKGFLKTQSARERSRRQWEELSVRLNSLGGTLKTPKQWTKYWSDKKSSVKKKAAARSAARRRTGGGVENEVTELSELEERVVVVCGGETFATGDAYLGMQPFPENNTSSPTPPEMIFNIPQHSGTPAEEPAPIVIYSSEQNNQRSAAALFARRLFPSCSSTSTSESQSILQNIPLIEVPPPINTSLSPPPIPFSPPPIPLSPPPIRLSHTLTPSPSRRGSTQATSPVIRGRNAASTSTRQSHAAPIASPSRRPRTRPATNRPAGSVSSRRISPIVAPPPSQRRTELNTLTDRFLRVEEQQLEINRANSQILQSLLDGNAQRERAMEERNAERDRVLAEALTAVGKGLHALADALNKDRV